MEIMSRRYYFRTPCTFETSSLAIYTKLLTMYFMDDFFFLFSLSLIPPQDFGDYSESFYSVQTTEGETISQLIAGYIDIIMQKKRPIHGEVPDDEDEPVIVELDVDPQR